MMMMMMSDRCKLGYSVMLGISPTRDRITVADS